MSDETTESLMDFDHLLEALHEGRIAGADMYSSDPETSRNSLAIDFGEDDDEDEDEDGDNDGTNDSSGNDCADDSCNEAGAGASREHRESVMFQWDVFAGPMAALAKSPSVTARPPSIMVFSPPTVTVEGCPPSDPLPDAPPAQAEAEEPALPPPSEVRTYLEHCAVHRLDVGKLTEAEAERQRLMFELYATERTYVANLQLLFNVYANPFVKAERTRSLRMALGEAESAAAGGSTAVGESSSLAGPAEEARSPMSLPTPLQLALDEVPEIIKANSQLLAELEAAFSGVGLVASVAAPVANFAERLKHYAAYVNLHPGAVDAFQEARADSLEFAAYFDELAASPSSGSVPMLSYMVKPVQRIIRYPLLVEALLHATPESSPDHAELSSALRKLQVQLHALNESRRTVESRQVVHELAAKVAGFDSLVAGRAARLFVSMHDVIKYTQDNKRSHPRTLVLLSDVLLVLRAKKDNKYVLGRSLPLEQLAVTRPRETATRRHLLRIQHVGGRHFVVSFPSADFLDAFHASLQDQITWASDRLGAILKRRHMLLRRSSSASQKVTDLMLFAEGLDSLGLDTGETFVVREGRLSIIDVYSGSEMEVFCYLCTDCVFWTVENPALGKRKRAKPQKLHTCIPLVELFVAVPPLDPPAVPDAAGESDFLSLSPSSGSATRPHGSSLLLVNALQGNRPRGASHLHTASGMANSFTIVHTGVAKFRLFFDSGSALYDWQVEFNRLIKEARDQGPATRAPPLDDILAHPTPSQAAAPKKPDVAAPTLKPRRKTLPKTSNPSP